LTFALQITGNLEILNREKSHFTVDHPVGSAHVPIQFIDTSTGNPVSWYWYFGDGESSTLQNPEHTYSYLGVYSVQLKVGNAAGNNISASRKIYMADSPTDIPTIVTAQQITAPYTITSPGTYTLGSDCKGVIMGGCSITINASDVTLDGAGHTLFGNGIIVEKNGKGVLSGITIRNLWIEGGAYGIWLSDSKGARISNVTIVETVMDGLIIKDSKNVRVENSTFIKNVDLILDPIYQNLYHGGILLTGTENVVITGCIFEDHFNAIVLLNSTDTTISSNYFHNVKDILYHSANGTTIYNNYISVVDVNSDKTTNALNTTLQNGPNIIGGNRLGGNYWYKDDGSGYSQTCMDDNHSGICKNPYELSSPSALNKTLRTDYFPLAGPVVSGKPVHPVITPKQVHTIPIGSVYHQMSPTPAPLPFSLALFAIMIGALVACLRR
jgi:parallel beta-helix repeat protein